jgi:hypothetical protein
VRHLSRGVIFLVIGYDKFVGAKNPQHGIIFALPQA